MPKNILIQGAPGIGKTTLIKHLLKDLTPLVVRGFYTESIIDNNECKGYRVISPDLDEQILAHVFIEGPNRVDNFGVNVEGFEKFALNQLNQFRGTELFLIDEIGIMECMSNKFCEQIKIIMESNIPLLATIKSKAILKLLKLSKKVDFSFINISHKNRNYLWKTILLELD